jgi:hypothetical protein
MTIQEHLAMEDEKAIVIWWGEKNNSATKMYSKLLASAEAVYPAYPAIANWVKTLTRSERIRGHASGAGPMLDDKVYALVTVTEDESPFHSLDSFASTVKISPTRAWRHLHSRGDAVPNLQSVPYTRSAAQKAARDESTIELKDIPFRETHPH